MTTVAITNRQRKLPIDRRRMRQVVEAILRDAKIEDGHVGVAVLSDAAIARLHDEFLGNPEPTDVLSFVLERSAGRLEGEIVVSAEMARAAAARWATTAADELLRYVIHGALHLVGYDDATPRKRAIMRRRERKYLTTR